MHRPGILAVIEREPWLDEYSVRLAGRGEHECNAVGVGDDGRIVYETHIEFRAVQPFLRLSHSELEAIAKAILAEERPEDATLNALNDARATRDRLLTLIERGWGDAGGTVIARAQ